jgi:hypothetical protein
MLSWPRLINWLTARAYRYERFEVRLGELQGEVMALLRDRRDLRHYLARTLERTMTDFIDARWDTSQHFTTGHAGLKPDFIVLTVADEIPENMAYHYYIEATGDIMQMVSEEHSAVNFGFSTGRALWWNFVNTKMNPDFVCFHILLRSADGALTSEQLAHAFVLIKDLCVRHRIQETEADQFGGICGIEQIDPFYHHDNAKNFPFSALVAYLASGVIQLPKPQVSPVVAVEDAPVEPVKPEETVAPKRKKRSEVSE